MLFGLVCSGRDGLGEEVGEGEVDGWFVFSSVKSLSVSIRGTWQDAFRGIGVGEGSS